MTRAPSLLRLVLRSAVGSALRGAWLALFALVPLFVARVAGAAPTEVRAEVGQDVVGRGMQLRLTLSASTESASLSGAEPNTPAWVRVEKVGERPSHTIQIGMGGRSEKRRLDVEWILVPQKLGTLTFRPSVLVGGTKTFARAITVKVVPPDKAPPPPPTPSRRNPLDILQDPFFKDPFKDPLFDPFRDLQKDFDADEFTRTPSVAADPALALVTAPRGKHAFLHARTDKPAAVVGEQVTYSVYLFIDASQPEPRFEDIHEANSKDFLRMTILPDDQTPKMLGQTMLEGRPYTVKLLRKVALFPLRAGKLTIQPMQLKVGPLRGAATPRESERLVVDVTEPPLAGRPPGYVLGDVGKLRLEVTVTPREVEVGGAITVDARLEGTGNLPATLSPPGRKAVEWLPPDQRATLGPDDNGRIGGSRTFTWVVRGREPGSVDLGELSLPYYDADAKKYDVARASLGSLVVRGVAAKDEAPRVLEGLPPPLAAPGALATTATSPAMRRLFVAVWLGPPLLLGAFVVTVRVRQRLRDRRGALKADPRRREKAARAELERALKESDGRAADLALRKYVELALEERLAVRVVGLDAERLRAALTAAAVTAELARDVATLLGEAEASRYAPTPEGPEAAKARFERFKGLLERMPKKPAASGSTAAAAAVLLAVLAQAGPARAEPFADAAKALKDGRPEIAIAELEKLADRGVRDPNASFNRGLAYAERVRLGAGQPGDLGRAIHGFEEARRLSPDGAVRREAERANQLLRAEIARQHARGEAVELETHSFADSLTSPLSAATWAVLAALTSLFATGALAFALRRRGEATATARRVVVGATVVAVVLAPLSVGSAWAARHVDESVGRETAVVLAAESRGFAKGRTPVPEGAIVEVVESEAGLATVLYRGSRVTLPRPTLRVLATR